MKVQPNTMRSGPSRKRLAPGGVVWGLAMVFWLAGLAPAAQRQQDFGTDPNWEGIGNREGTQDFGFVESANAGGSPGELGGVIARAADRAYYADRLESLTLDDSLSCTGRVALTQSGDGTAWLLGWFNAAETGWLPVNYIGFRSDGNSSQSMDIYLRSGNSARDGLEGRAVAGVAADGASHAFSFVYNPSANDGHGAIIFTWDGTNTATFNLTAEHRAGGASFDRFGLLNLQAPANAAAAFFDDLNYTATPELTATRPPQISELQPANGSSFVDAATGLSFQVASGAGVQSGGIQLFLNELDRTGDLLITGDNALRQVRLGGAGLAENTIYAGRIVATDVRTNKTELTFSFNTFRPDNFTIEAEDYNFERGQFINAPVPSDAPGPESYFDRAGVEGIDYHQVDQAGDHIYRSQDAVGTLISSDVRRQKYVDNFATEINVDAFGAGEWLNFTRSFPTNAYLLYARALVGGSLLVANLERVYGDSTVAGQTTAALGAFRSEPISQAAFLFVPLTDTAGSDVVVRLGGQRTLRLAVASAGLTINYLMFVPTADPGPQLPILGDTTPAAGQTRVPPDAAIIFSIVNRDTELVPSTIQFVLNNADVTAGVVVIPTPSGVTVRYQPPNPLPPEAVSRIQVAFSDNAVPANRVTNQWEFTTGALRPQIVQRQQSFDTDPNWTASGNRDAGQDFGFSDSANAGGSPGEMGGIVLRSAGRAIYADDIGILTLEDRLSCTGRVALTQSGGNTAWLFGWLNSAATGWPPLNYLGFRMDGNSTANNDLYIRSGNLEEHAVSGVVADGTPHTFSLVYDPAANSGNGAVSLTWDGTLAGTLNLTAAHRAAGATFDRFGLHDLQAGGQAAGVFFDDLDYTATQPAAPPFRIAGMTLQGTSFSLSIATELGRNYTVEFKNSLGDPNWQMLPSVAGDGTVKTLTDSSATGPARFYRVRTP